MLGLKAGLSVTVVTTRSAGGAPTEPPINTFAPVLVGSFFAGQKMICLGDMWDGSPTAFEHKWQFNTVDNGGVADEYTTIRADDAKVLRCLVRAQNAAGWSDWVASNSYIILALENWIDSADTATISQSGGSVSAQADKSGRGYSFTQPTSTLQPKTGVYTVNGLNAVSYDGVDDTLAMPAFATFGPAILQSNTSQMHVSVPRALPTTKNIYWLFGGGGTRFGFEFAAGIGVRVFSGNNAFANIAMGGSPPLDVPYVVAGRRTGNTIEGFVNGNAYTGSAPNTNGGLANYVNLGNAADVLHCESIVAARAWTAAEMNQVGNYLKNKWGVTWVDIS